MIAAGCGLGRELRIEGVQLIYHGSAQGVDLIEGASGRVWRLQNGHDSNALALTRSSLKSYSVKQLSG